MKPPLPKLWAGGVAFILGGGPSLNTVNLELIRRRRVIGVNNAYGDPVKDSKGKTKYYEPRPWVDFCWFGDSTWFGRHREWGLQKFPGLIAHCVPKLLDRDHLIGYKRGKPRGIAKKADCVSWNSCSGSSAINLAYHLGVRRVVLLGFDMRRVDGEANWHTDHPSPNKDPYARFLKCYPFIAADAKELGLEIINCTPGSAITQFPIMTLEDYLTREESDNGCV